MADCPKCDYVQAEDGRWERKRCPEHAVTSAAAAEVAAETRFPRTDAGNAEMFASLYGDRVRFDHRRKRWLVWQRHGWETDRNGAVHRLALEAARKRYAMASLIQDLDDRKREAAWAIQAESRQKLDGALALAASTVPIADTGDDWDADPWALATLNGVVDLRTGRLSDGHPENRITRHVPIVYYPHTACPRWELFLHEIFGGDAALIDYVHRAIGYSLTGDVSEQAVFVGIGGGANGKTTLLDVLRTIGGAHAYNMPFATIELNARAAIPNDLADLDGRRIVTASETAEGARLNEARLKALTGGDPVTARYLFGEFFTFRPRAKFWLAVNHRPRVHDLSVAFWRRVRLIPFNQQFTENADKSLTSKLQAEAPGILAWAVKGCLEWQRRGLEPPDTVKVATDDYRRESDPLGEFLTECCILDDYAVTSSASLFIAYLGWARDQHLRERDMLSRTAFGRLLGATFNKGLDAAGRATYGGIRLRNPEGLGPIPRGFEYEGSKSALSSLENSSSRENTENPSNPSDTSGTLQGELA